MSRDLVAALLKSKARQDYERLLLVRYTFLCETLRKEAGTAAAAADYLQENLAPLGDIPAQVLLQKATPFFLMNLQRCYRAGAGDAASLPRYSRNLVMMAVDSFFEHLPEGRAFHLRSEEGFNIALPRLGVSVPAPGGGATLRRLDGTKLEVGLASGQLIIDTSDVPGEYALPSIAVPGHESTLLLSCDPALFEDDYISNIELDTPNAIALSRQISKALNLIGRVDEVLFSQVSRYIRWYIPLVNPHRDTTHFSFTAKNLPGLIFLSGSYRFLPLCEAIVHEYHHHELYVLMGTQEVLGKETDRLFYSPWRTDARPLSGLFHAVHVFTGVSDFYSRIIDMGLPELEVYEKDIRYRRVLLYHQLRIGLAQVPGEELAPLGRKIYEYVEGQLDRFKTELGAEADIMPREIFTHFEDWSALYPELVPGVNLPAAFLTQSSV